MKVSPRIRYWAEAIAPVGVPRRIGEWLPASRRMRRLRDELLLEKAALEQLSESLEREFLDAGTLLRQIAGLAREVRERSAELVAISGADASRPGVGLAFQLLKEAEDLVSAGHDRYDGVSRVFRDVHGALTEIGGDREFLLRLLLALEVTAIQFHVQSCPLPGEVRDQFHFLAHSIRSLVSDIRDAVGLRFDELAQTRGASRELIAHVSEMVDRQRREAGDVLTSSRSQLTALEEMLRVSDDAARSVSGMGERIGAGVQMAIVALQAQDLARQKMQHIGQAIDSMVESLGAAGRGRGLARQERQHYLRNTASIQGRQVAAVFEHLEEAAGQLRAGLQGIEAEGRRMAEGSRQVGEAAAESARRAQSAGNTQRILDFTRSAHQQMDAVMKMARALESAFTDCAAGIRGLVFRLQMVALNAQIFAANVPGGAVLEVVAQQASDTAAEAMRLLEAISGRLSRTGDAVTEMGSGLEDFRQLSKSDRESLVADMGHSEGGLAAIGELVGDASARLRAADRELAGRIGAALESIRFQAAIAPSRERSVLLFERIAEQYGSEGAGTDLSHSHLEALRRNYTMAHERVVHEEALSALGGSATPAAPASGEAAPAGETEVMFFDMEALELRSQPDPSAAPGTEPEATGGDAGAGGQEERSENLGDNIELF